MDIWIARREQQAGQSGTTETGQQRQGILERKQLEYSSKDTTAGQNISGQDARAGQLRKDSWDRKDGTGRLGQESRGKQSGMTAGTRQSGQNSQNRTAGKGQPERTVRIVLPGQKRENRKART